MRRPTGAGHAPWPADPHGYSMNIDATASLRFTELSFFPGFEARQQQSASAQCIWRIVASMGTWTPHRRRRTGKWQDALRGPLHQRAEPPRCRGMPGYCKTGAAECVKKTGLRLGLREGSADMGERRWHLMAVSSLGWTKEARLQNAYFHL